MTYNWRDISKDFTVEIEINEDFREKIVEIRRLALRCPPRILGDPGANSGGEGKSKRAEK